MKSGKIVSIRLQEEELRKLSEISKNEGVKRSNIIRKALRNFIQNYGKRQPDVGDLHSRIEEMDRKFGNLLNRVNILTNQIDHLIAEKRQR